jgi:hypothetical protein
MSKGILHSLVYRIMLAHNYLLEVGKVALITFRQTMSVDVAL